MIETRLRHQYAHAPIPGPKTEQPLAIPPSAPAKNGSAAFAQLTRVPGFTTIAQPLHIHCTGFGLFGRRSARRFVQFVQRKFDAGSTKGLVNM